MRKPPPSKPGTRARVMAVALDLFNATGVDRVTTRLIAEGAGINEGNLYYHFRTKEALVLALLAQFEGEVLAALDAPVPAGEDGLGPYAGMLRRWFGLTWTYRFLLRDVLFLQAADPVLQARLRAVAAQLKAATGAVLDAMQAAGLIRIPAEARDSLLANLSIVSSYWISYLVLHEGVQAVTPAHLGWGLGQVRALYAPYLTAAARAWLAENPDPAPLA